MPIPGYDPDDIAERSLEREDGESARVSLAAGTVPEAFDLATSDADPPVGALSDPVDVVGLEEVAALDALQFALAYDPGGLPARASPTDVAVAVVTGDGLETLDSAVDLEATTVSAAVTDLPSSETVVTVHDEAASESEE